jgi:hypothetical protein
MSDLINNYIDNLVEKIANKEGGCSRNRKPEKVEFWIHRPNYTTVVNVTYVELERCMMLATYPEHLRKYIE